jgi:hypothetical protein
MLTFGLAIPKTRQSTPRTPYQVQKPDAIKAQDPTASFDDLLLFFNTLALQRRRRYRHATGQPGTFAGITLAG